MRRGSWLIIVLPYITILNGIKLDFGALGLRIEQAAIAVLLLIFLAICALRKGKLKGNKSDRYLLLYWLLLILPSYFNAPDPKYSLVQTFSLILISSTYFIMSSYANTEVNIKRYLYHSFNATIIVSLIGNLLFFISVITGYALYGINLAQNESDPFGIYLTMVEPNIYGGYMMGIFFLALTLYSTKSYEQWGFSRSFIALALICATLGVLLSFTRGVWLAIVVGLLIFYFNSFKKLFSNIRKLLIFSFFIVAGLFFLKYVLKIDIITYKLDNFLSTDVGTGQGRLLIWGLALDSWVESKKWLIGNGTYSFASFFNTHNYDQSTNAWIGNLLITILHDSGLIGFLVFVGFIVSLIKGTKVVKTTIEGTPDVRHLMTGTRLAIIGMMIEFFFTTGLSLSFCWLLFGFSVGLSRYGKGLNKLALAQEQEGIESKS